MKRIFCVFMVLVLSLGLLSGCGDGSGDTAPDLPTGATEVDATGEVNAKNPVAIITMTDGKQIFIELYPDIAPITVHNFISLANSGFYDGIVFHRALANRIIQGGDPNGNGSGGPGYSIKGEFNSNGVENNLKHERGVISMARRNMPLDSAGSQFFIIASKSEAGWDGDYAAFGKVIEGMDVVDALSRLPVADEAIIDKPAMKTVRVDLKGETYEEPETIK